MSKILHITAAAALAGVIAAAASARETHYAGTGVPESIRYYESVGMLSSTSGATTNGVEKAAVTLSFYTLGRQFDLELEPNEIFAPGATVVWVDDAGVVEEPADPEGFYRGRVAGEPDSWVRLRLQGDSLAGVVATADELYFLEPAQRFFGQGASGETLAYRVSDTDSEWEPGSCAAHDDAPKRFRRSKRLGARRPTHEAFGAALAVAEQAGSLKRADLGLVADYEYFTKHGAESAADLAEVINGVDGVYQTDVGVTIQILTTVVYSTASDPFSSTTNPNTLLSEFSTFKNNNDNSAGQLLYGTDFAHLVTGRDLDGSVIGVAWLGTVCSSYYGAGLSQDYTTSLYNLVLLQAHEMGHNFAAPHDNQAGSECANEPGIYIMNPMLYSGLQQEFSPCSKNIIGSYVASVSCLDTVAPPPPPGPPTLDPIPSPIVVGAPLTLTGTNFTAGSVMQLFVATASGTVAYGPYSPTSRTSTSLTFSPLSASIALGNGFGTAIVINTDQNYVQSNAQSQLLYGAAASNIPTITALNGVALRAFDPTIPLATVETVVTQGTTVTITGTGFNGALVNLFTAAGNKGPLAPLPGATATQIQVVIPADTPTGPGSFQVVNNPYAGNVLSNAVSVPIGARVTITSIVQNGSTVTVNGTGFSTMSVINLFNNQGGGRVVNLGGLSGGGPRIPLTLVNSTQFTFAVPAGAVTGPSYLQVLNPPYIPYSSSGNDPDGAFTLVVP